MMTWSLWRSFNAKRLPQFVRIPSKYILPAVPEIRLDSSLVVIFVIVVFIILIVTNTVGYVGYTIYLIPIAGTLVGSIITTAIGQRIGVASENGSLDLMSVTPLGRSGATWAISLDTFQRHGTIRYLQQIAIGLYQIILGIWILTAGAAILLWLMLRMGESPAYVPQSYVTIWNAVVVSGLIGLGLYVDFVQSTLAGSIIAMLIPGWAMERDNGRIVAAGLYLLNQIVLYIFALIIIFLGMTAHQHAAWYIDFVIPIVAFTVIYLMREINLAILFYLLARRFYVSRRDLRQLMRRTE